MVMMLGDNIFYGHGLLAQSVKVFGYYVSDPERYGVAEFNDNKY
jgi:glucose-1-phosphate thymidylyltransferase